MKTIQRTNNLPNLFRVIHCFFSLFVVTLLISNFPKISLAAQDHDGSNATLENYQVDSILNTLATKTLTRGSMVGIASEITRFEKELVTMSYYPLQLDPPFADSINPNESITAPGNTETSTRVTGSPRDGFR